MRIELTSFLRITCLLFFSAGSLFAQTDDTAKDGQPSVDSAKKSADREDGDKKSVRPEVSSEDRGRALGFATEHHPELARLLEQLEKPRPGEFARAVRELNVQIQRLEKLREKTPARYDEQLAAWKAESQIRVLMARWSRSRSPELESQIRELLTRRHEARVARLKADQERLESQLSKVKSELAGMPDSAEQVDREWKALAAKAAPAKKNADAKQAGDKPAKQSHGENKSKTTAEAEKK